MKRWSVGVAGLVLAVGTCLFAGEARAAWQEFTSEEYGIKFSLPENWNVEVTAGDSGKVWAGSSSDESMGFLLTIIEGSEDSPRKLFRNFVKEIEAEVDEDTVDMEDDTIIGIATAEMEGKPVMAIVGAGKEGSVSFLFMAASDVDQFEKNEKTLSKIFDSLDTLESDEDAEDEAEEADAEEANGEEEAEEAEE